MPRSAPRPCSHLGCNALVRDGSGRCPKHPREPWAKPVAVTKRITGRRLLGRNAGRGRGHGLTQEHADAVLRRRVAQFMLATLARCPALHLEPPSRVAACVSLAYNIGVGAFGASSVSRLTMRQDFPGAAERFLLWIRAGGRTVAGLLARRRLERDAYLAAAAIWPLK